MNRSTAVAFALAGLALVAGAAPAVAAPAPRTTKAERETRHSGTIVAVDRTHETLTLSEMVPLKDDRNSLVRRTIGLSGSTRVELEQRGVVNGWRGAYEATPMPVDRLTPGEFATVVTDRTGHGLQAREIDVVKLAGQRTAARS